MILYLIIYIISTFSYFIIIKIKSQNTELIKYNQLKNYINLKNKKRIFRVNKCKNTDKTTNIHYKLYKTFNYKKLDRSYLSVNFYLYKENKYTTYVERENMNVNNNLKIIAKEIDFKINHCQNKFRALKNQCIVETIAKSYAHAILIENNFNVFKEFKELSMQTKIYKKEANFLKILIIANLIDIYKKLQNDIICIKKHIINNKNCLFFKRGYKYEKMYGMYLFNKSNSQYLLNNKFCIINATKHVINELDEICLKQKIIYNYIKFLL